MEMKNHFLWPKAMFVTFSAKYPLANLALLVNWAMKHRFATLALTLEIQACFLLVVDKASFCACVLLVTSEPHSETVSIQMNPRSSCWEVLVNLEVYQNSVEGKKTEGKIHLLDSKIFLC